MDRDSILSVLNNRDLSDIHPNQRPRKAASLIVWCGPRNTPKLLMGKRANTLKFMPGKYVFPGGAAERADSSLKPAGQLSKQDQTRLGPTGQTLAIAAIRECFEETGLRVAATHASPSQSHIWKDYTSPGLRPDLSKLLFLARAITPPRRIRRFDTYFFLTEADTQIPKQHLKASSPEIENVDWIALEKAPHLNIAPMTQAILEEIKLYFSGELRKRAIYKVVGGKFTCTEID